MRDWNHFLTLIHDSRVDSVWSNYEVITNDSLKNCGFFLLFFFLFSFYRSRFPIDNSDTRACSIIWRLPINANSTSKNREYAYIKGQINERSWVFALLSWKGFSMQNQLIIGLAILGNLANKTLIGFISRLKVNRLLNLLNNLKWNKR